MNQQIVVILLMVGLVVAVLLIALGVKIVRAGNQQVSPLPRLDQNSIMTKEESDRSVIAEWLSTLREDDDGV